MTVEPVEPNLPTRAQLYRLVDALPDHNLDVARRLLEVLTESDPRPSGDDAPEPWMREVLDSLSADELHAIHAATEDEAARLIVEHAERRGILIPAEDDAEVEDDDGAQGR